MRLAISLSLWLAATSALVLGAHGWLQLSIEQRDLEAATRRQLILVTTAVQSTVENALRDAEEPDVYRVIEDLKRNDPPMDIFVLGEGDTLIASSRGSAGNLAAAQTLARSAESLNTVRIEPFGSDKLAAVAPLRVGESTVGDLVVLRATSALQADLAAERQALFISIAGLLVALCLVIASVVHLRLHRPMKAMATTIRRVSEGDLSARINLAGTDEIAELAREFDNMTNALQRAQERIAEEAARRERMEDDMQKANKLMMVGELAASLAHEIGSPLQVLHGRARDLAKREDFPLEARRSAEVLVEQTDRVHRIVERLLHVARRKPAQLHDIDVRETVQLVTELLSGQARGMGIRLEVETRDVPSIRADADQVQQVVLNLLQNALRACRRGGTVRVSISPSSFIRPMDSGEQPSVAIAVEDTGQGIPESVRARIFEPFFTAWDNGTEPGGMGLGLSVVKSIVAEHGGVVSATTGPSGAGARFTVHFPAGSTPSAAVAEAP